MEKLLKLKRSFLVNGIELCLVLPGDGKISDNNCVLHTSSTSTMIILLAECLLHHNKQYTLTQCLFKCFNETSFRYM